MDNKKKTNPVDVHVGAKIRLRRNLLRLSQEKLGDALGITFQQVQKYEKGLNRIGASRLQAIAAILNVPVSFFFDEAPSSVSHHHIGFAEEKDSSLPLVDFFKTSEALQLNRLFVAISNPKVRSNIIELLRNLADIEEKKTVNEKKNLCERLDVKAFNM